MPFRKFFNPARILVLGFLSVIIIGTFLLTLPAASRKGVEVPVLSALFTAVSASTITGLVVMDTAQTWSVFGLTVILCMIQMGGLGFMSVITVFFFMMRKKIGLSQRLLMMQTMSLHDIQGVVRLVRHVLFGTLFFQGFGALLLWTRFGPNYGLLRGLGMSIFHAVSAFCNAGFDLMDGEFTSLTEYFADATVSIVITALVFIGGLGFFVWEDIWRNHNFRKLHVYSKLVLVSSFCLVVGSGVFYFFAERTNPYTFGAMSIPDAVLSSIFQAVMPRSGGLATVNQASLRGVSQMFTIILMLIGGSAGSTAGGIKNVTVTILILSALASLRGKSRTSVFGRTLPAPQILSALSIAVLVLTLCVGGAVVIAFIQPELGFTGILFETTSAIATCGLSLGTTPALKPVSQVIIMLFMLFGRVGIMTLGMAVFFNRNKTEKIKYPDTWVIIG